MSPAEYEVHPTERFAYLPHCFQPNDTTRSIPDGRTSRADVGLKDGQFVFCCFNAGYKFTPAVIDSWMCILKRVPDSLLWLLVQSHEQTANLAQEAKTKGIAPDRLVFAPPASLEQHSLRCSLADLFLDNLPVGAFTTASDALWAGLPIRAPVGLLQKSLTGIRVWWSSESVLARNETSSPVHMAPAMLVISLVVISQLASDCLHTMTRGRLLARLGSKGVGSLQRVQQPTLVEQPECECLTPSRRSVSDVEN